ncbi:uncharacterized protein LOC122553943 [Chiloscyllium plagiosum]|uniref:uncharacterized protein LOC122553943 n=1 Tax=Chiloscyllium plagiosum TaxID=36176 RepID=UPI001CB7C174|nr:uncharacterized protein LOC122553943 [Chiloscyllium plagiosum]
MLGAHHLNKFLTILLNYFSAFLSKYELESKTSNFMTAMEQIEIAEANTKMDLARKLMAQIYCKMLLGLGMAKQHHMACGKRLQTRRPPINTILNQRSPVLTSLIQTPREKSAYLFKHHHVNPKFRADVADQKTKVLDLKLELAESIGIIGEPFSNFFSDTLIPIDSYIENEGTEESVDEEALLQKSGYSHSTAIESSLGDMNSHHQYLDMSRATTVAADSEYNL